VKQIADNAAHDCGDRRSATRCSTGNLVGACSVMHRGLRNLANYPLYHSGIHLNRLLSDVSQWLDALEKGLPLPPHPRVHTSNH